MQPTNRNAATKTLLRNKLFKQFSVLYSFPLLPYQCTVDCGMWKGVECEVWSVKVEC